MEVERTCFESDTLSGSPITFAGALNLVDAMENFVDGAWDCDFVAEQQVDGNVSCVTLLADSASCLASKNDFLVYW